ncbi:hypothetical protein BJV82DRAFT_634033 [Fennellomyces sp. T-0311]|nr:hypothetical protein BJV82DRAFT_634033 [Fennellomyces sp. T-0311]
MDVQGYMPAHRPEDPQVLHYAQVNLTPSSSKAHALPPLASLPAHVANEQECNGSVASEGRSSSPYASSLPLKRDSPFSAIPAYVFDKRKSSPAVLGLPLGLNDEAQAQLSLHLSQQRNSIEAAMLLANFNRLPSTPAADKDQSAATADDASDHKPWPDNDSYSVASDGALSQNSTTRQRRYSYDVSMTWASLPSDRSTFLQDMSGSSSSSSSASSLVHHQQQLHPQAKLTWVQGMSPPMLPPPSSSFPVPEPITMIHPLSQATSAAPKHDQAPAQPPPPPPPPQHPHYYPYHPHPYMHHPAAPPPPAPPPGSAQSSAAPAPPHYYYQHVGKLPLPLPVDGMMHTPLPGQYAPMPAGPVRSPNRRKKNRMEVDEDDMSTAVEPGDPDFPDMSLKDIEAARLDPEARPRRQKLRYVGDKYTPQWVRYNGQAKEGLCDTCQPGKWLQLKNSAFWYHKQFFHGISSVSGKEFMQPLETRWVDQDLVEGLCHQCRQWVSVSNVKRKNSVLWYRHAHKCHVYHKPKPNAPKRR